MGIFQIDAELLKEIQRGSTVIDDDNKRKHQELLDLYYSFLNQTPQHADKYESFRQFVQDQHNSKLPTNTLGEDL